MFYIPRADSNTYFTDAGGVTNWRGASCHGLYVFNTSVTDGSVKIEFMDGSTIDLVLLSGQKVAETFLKQIAEVTVTGATTYEGYGYTY